MITRHHFIRSTGALLLAAPAGWAGARDLAAECAPPHCATPCGPTGAAIEGPYFVRNLAPGSGAGPAAAATGVSAVDINLRRAHGKPMQVSGVVHGGADGNTPLAGVRVEIWHCDAEGNYHPDGNGDVSRYPAEAVNLRGVSETDGQGRFAFDSIVPGTYGIRRRHLHWRFEASGHQALTTQTYWRQDKSTLRARTDVVDREAEACRWLSFANNPQGVAQAFFDVRLVRA